MYKEPGQLHLPAHYNITPFSYDTNTTGLYTISLLFSNYFITYTIYYTAAIGRQSIFRLLFRRRGGGGDDDTPIGCCGFYFPVHRRGGGASKTADGFDYPAGGYTASAPGLYYCTYSCRYLRH